MYIFPKPKTIKETNKEFVFGKKMVLTISKDDITVSQVKLLKELYRNFTCGIGSLTINLLDGSSKSAILSTEKEVLSCKKIDKKYLINIDDKKAQLFFVNNKSFANAFCTLLSMIEARTIDGQLGFTLPICEIEDYPTVAFRGIHFCVFPETRYNMLKKFIRFAGFVKYTHIIIEFWGMYKYRCCKALARKNAYSEKQVKALVKEANALGMEVIPMLNCLGHAAQNRAMYGKHVVLDQEPKLAPLFEPDGWTWNLKNPDTIKLLISMRKELIDVCGKGEYFHIGCDEAFPYGSSRLFNGVDKIDVLIEHINSISKEMKGYGRRVMMWGDQMLFPQKDWAPAPANIAYAESQETADKLISKLDKDIIITDWEYYASEKVMPTSKLLSESGFDVILAPFDCLNGTKTCVNNVVENKYYGLLQTTWHLMHGDRSDWEGSISMVLRSADMFWNGNEERKKIDGEFMLFQTATYYRKLLPPKGKYKDCGIKETDIET